MASMAGSWECPSREKCIYRHALPPGFVFKTKKAAVEDEGPKITVEQLVEEEVSLLAAAAACLVKIECSVYTAREADIIRQGTD